MLLSRLPEIHLPHDLKVIFLPYYYDQTIKEDLELIQSFKIRSYPSLESVIVPSALILRNGTTSDSDDLRKLWFEGRRELQKAEIFQSGKVKLRFVEPGECSEYCVEVFEVI